MKKKLNSNYNIIRAYKISWKKPHFLNEASDSYCDLFKLSDSHKINQIYLNYGKCLVHVLVT